jgi:hypothetical protein
MIDVIHAEYSSRKPKKMPGGLYPSKKKKGISVAIFNMYVSNLQNGMLVPTAR